jgi:NADP-dependent 3-hydroxy acid dehydrogenase YdfG
MKTGNLTGKVAVITGASSGIGLAVARELHSYGMKLVLTARCEDTLSRLKSELQAAVLAGNVTEPSLPGRLLALALSTHGRCDVVLNNAGMMELGSIASIDIDKMCEMVRVNVEAVYRIAYVFMRQFVLQGHGHLVNTSSVLGTKIRLTAGAYAGTKYAIEALSEALRLEVSGTAVKVSCIEPGLVRTGLHRDWPVHLRESIKMSNPLQPEDVARCVGFLLSQPDHVRIPKLMIVPGESQI